MASNSKIKISLTGPPETLLVTLLARHWDNAVSSNPVLQDQWATQALERLDYDFSRLSMQTTFCQSITLRSLVFDNMTAEFLDAHQETAVTVLHLAAGLDSRSLRLNDWYADRSDVRWIDVDVPEVVELRREILPNPKGDYALVGIDLTADAWAEQIPNDRPTVVVFEGLTPYLTETDGKKLFRAIAERFSGGQILFDAFSPVCIRLYTLVWPMRSMSAIWTWGIGDPKSLESVHEKLEMVDATPLWEEEAVVKFPLYRRIGAYITSWIPGLRWLQMNIRYRF
jgi:O-methyltransferase involved in polyketide biosynthesis